MRSGCRASGEGARPERPAPPSRSCTRWQRLYFFPLPHQQGSFDPIFTPWIRVSALPRRSRGHRSIPPIGRTIAGGALTARRSRAPEGRLRQTRFKPGERRLSSQPGARQTRGAFATVGSLSPQFRSLCACLSSMTLDSRFRGNDETTRTTVRARVRGHGALPRGDGESRRAATTNNAATMPAFASEHPPVDHPCCCEAPLAAGRRDPGLVLRLP